MQPKPPAPQPKWNLPTAFAVGIGAVWIIATLVSLVTGDYTALGIVTPVMLLAAGFVFGLKATR